MRDRTALKRSTFGAHLAALRREAGVSQMELSVKSGVSARHLSFLETGRSLPSTQMIRRLAAALDLSPEAEGALRESAGFARTAGLLPRLSHSGAMTADRLLRGLLDVQIAADADGMVRTAEALLAPFGIDSFFCVTLIRGRGSELHSIRSRAGRFPSEWLEYYGQQSYQLFDPLRQEAGRSHRSFFWSDLPHRIGPLKLEQRRILMDAREYGITNGFVCPQHLGDGRVRGVSMMGRDIDPADPMVRLALQMIGAALLDGWETFEPAHAT